MSLPSTIGALKMPIMMHENAIGTVEIGNRTLKIGHIIAPAVSKIGHRTAEIGHGIVASDNMTVEIEAKAVEVKAEAENIFVGITKQLKQSKLPAISFVTKNISFQTLNVGFYTPIVVVIKR